MLAHKLLPGFGSIRQHTLSLVDEGQIFGHYAADKLLAGVGLHYASSCTCIMPGSGSIRQHTISLVNLGEILRHCFGT
jgi:hypothetical protein